MVSADAFRELYRYHFAISRKIWDACIVPLPQDLFVDKAKAVKYGIGSVRNHVVHMISVDRAWFSGLRNDPFPGDLNPVYFHKRDKIRALWDEVEVYVREYLDTVTDEQINGYPFEGDDDDAKMQLWQVLFHVLNHGTDHRAQLLRLLNDLGAKTFPQDYVFHLTTFPRP